MLSVFDEYDFKSDSERPELLVHTNEDLIAEDEDFAILSKNYEGKKSPETMLKALLKAEISVYTFDAYSLKGKVLPNPTRQLRTHRNRMFLLAETHLVLRTELTMNLGMTKL